MEQNRDFGIVNTAIDRQIRLINAALLILPVSITVFTGFFVIGTNKHAKGAY
jgi:hypothetical protein